MINSIKLKNIASYKQESSLNTDKKINLIYGLNGTGKTTLSNFLKDKNNIKFSECSISDGETAKILVYNQEFINENFYEKNDLKGIFTISEANKEAEKKIEDAKAQISKLKEQESAKKLELESICGEKNNNLSETTGKIWGIKTTFFGKDKILGYCLDGLKGSQKALFEHFYKINKPNSKPTKTTDDLKKEILQIEGSEAIELGALQKIVLNNVAEIEQNIIFDEVIVGNTDSTVANLIENFQNSDWVKAGLNYLPDDIEKAINCPFCQQKTITKNLADEIKNYFDKTYQDKVDLLKNLKRQYEASKNNIMALDLFLINEYAKSKKAELENLYTKLIAVLSNNIATIENKIKLPSNKATLQNSNQVVNDFNECIEKINQEIVEHNKKNKR